jgi:hypothetical protein
MLAINELDCSRELSFSPGLPGFGGPQTEHGANGLLCR